MTGYWGKAKRAAEAARLLWEQGNTDGAVNRAYYSMFDAARAALQMLDPDLAIAKSHGTILRRFGRYIVVGRGLDRSLGRALRMAEKTRLTADYDVEAVSREEAKAVLDDMETMLEAIEAILLGDQQ
jgi:uncharacterized protein (UPF0332 family)